MATLAALGARSIPVVTMGREFVYAQDIDVLASFIGVESNRSMLPVEDLVIRIDMILAAAQRYLAQLPVDVLGTKLPGRDRSYLDLGFHVFMIPLAFLNAVCGRELTFEYFERTPPDDMLAADDVIVFGESVRDELREWWHAAKHGGYCKRVNTYYGRHSTHSVLERTTWHAAQHVRQLMLLVSSQGLFPDGPLGEMELAGLPLPAEVYDDEVALTQD